MNVIKKQSSVAGSKPVAGVLASGEIAINTVDGIIYSEDTAAKIREFRETPSFHELHDVQERDALVGDRSLHEGDFVRYVIGGVYQIDLYYNGKWYKVETSPPLFVMVIKMNTTDKPTFTDIIGGNIHIVARADNSWLVYSEDEIKRIRFDGFRDKVIYVMIIKSDHLSSMESMFEGCSELEGCGFSRLKTPHVRNMANMFKGCSKLEHTYSMLFDTSKVETMEGMFDGCSGLISAEIDHFDTNNVESTARMFANCSLLPDIDISHFSADSVINAKSMFDGCSLVESLDFVKFTLPVAMNTQTMFKDCTSLKCLSSINTTASADIVAKANMFANTPSLEEPVPADVIDIVDADGSNWVNSLSCPKLLTLRWNSQIGSVAFTVDGGAMEYTTDDGATWVDVPAGSREVPNGSGGPYILREKVVGSITRCAFESGFPGRSGIEGKIVVKGGMGLTNTVNMFTACEQLAEIDISGMFTGNLAEIHNMFLRCINLSEIKFGDFDTSSIISMRSLFNGSSALTDLDLTSFDMTNVTDTGYMFAGCNKLECVSNIDTISSNAKDHMFDNCVSLLNPDVAERANLVDSDGMFFVNPNICDTYIPKVKLFDMFVMSPTEPAFFVENGSVTVDYWGQNKWNVWSEEAITAIAFGANKADVTSVKLILVNTLRKSTNMFKGMIGLRDLQLAIWDTSVLVDTVDMFYDCSNLACIDQIDTTGSTNKANMFHGCTLIENPDAAAIIDIVDANGAVWVNPEICPKILTFKWHVQPSDSDVTITSSGTAGNVMEYSTDGGSTWVDMNAGLNDNKLIVGAGGPYILREKVAGIVSGISFKNGWGWAAGPKGEMVISGGFGLTSTVEMFTGITLSSINFDNFDSSGVIDMENMFHLCNSLVCISKLNTTTAAGPNIFSLAPLLQQPDAATIALMESPAGLDWTNPNPCP